MRFGRTNGSTVATGLASSITGAVRNARNNQGIANTLVILRRGQGGGAEGPSVAERTTDSSGGYSFAGLESGVYTVLAVPNAFKDCSRTTISLDSNQSTTQNLFCSPVGGNDSGIRIVLTWGQTPSDLDAHLTGPNATDANRFHVYYLTAQRGSETANPFSKLDTDQRNSLGPETITIKQMNSGVYRFSVHDYTNRNSATSTALGSSQAKVELYLMGELSPRTFYVPNQRGTLWTVFELTGSLDNPTVTPRNEMGLATEEASIL